MKYMPVVLVLAATTAAAVAVTPLAAQLKPGCGDLCYPQDRPTITVLPPPPELTGDTPPPAVVTEGPDPPGDLPKPHGDYGRAATPTERRR
jgi:hypothetical protein